MAIQMDPAQLAELLAALRGRGGGNKKTPELSSSSAEDWRTWRSNFEVLAVMNGWDDRRQNFEIFSAMTGDAKQLVSGIGHGNPAAPAGGGAAPAAPDPAVLLNAFEARFLPPAAGEVARMQYEQARQREGESLRGWHNRLRSLCLRAYPDQEPDPLRT